MWKFAILQLSHDCLVIADDHFNLQWYTCVNLLTLTLKVLVATIDAQWEGMGDVWSFVLFNDAWSQKGHSAYGLTYSLY